MSDRSKRDVVLLAALLDRHVTDAAFESGCRPSCGYDGDDLTRHMAEAVLASDWLAAIRDEAKAEGRAEQLTREDKRDLMAVYGYEVGLADGKAEALAPIRALVEEFMSPDEAQQGDTPTAEFMRNLRALLDGGDQS